VPPDSRRVWPRIRTSHVSKRRVSGFYYGLIFAPDNVFDGIEVSQAAFTFMYRFMANHSAEFPEGVLSKDVLKSWRAISGPEDELTWTKGHERIPDNWYRRDATVDSYTIPYCKHAEQSSYHELSINMQVVEADILYFAETVPQVLDIGCNQGAVNTYNAIDISTLTNGAYTAEQVAQSPLCFSTGFALAELPLITGLTAAALAPLTDIISSITTNMNCQAIGSVNQSALSVCPGLSLYGGPTGPVAPGAIQD
jgi:hypothetical protein